MQPAPPTPPSPPPAPPGPLAAPVPAPPGDLPRMMAELGGRFQEAQAEAAEAQQAAAEAQREAAEAQHNAAAQMGAEQAAPAARAVPRTAQELSAMRNLREELSNQLRSTQRRRDEVARQVRNSSDGATRAGLEQRLAVLDRRMVQLETDIAETGRLLTLAPASLLASTEAPPRPPRGERGPPEGVVAIVFIMFVLFPLVLTFARRYLRRPTGFGADPAAREAAERLGRLEQAVEAIAIEVERVSEGQRFVTRLLADARPPAEQAPALNDYRSR